MAASSPQGPQLYSACLDRDPPDHANHAVVPTIRESKHSRDLGQAAAATKQASSSLACPLENKAAMLFEDAGKQGGEGIADAH